MNKVAKHYFLKCVSLGAVLAMTSTSVLSLPYGSPDARSIAMGGTGVASADNAYAGFFNPALLASYDQRKDRGGNMRIVFPAIHTGLSTNVGDLFDFEDEGYEARVTSAVNTYNTTQSTTELLNVLDPLDTQLADISGDPLSADVFLGMVFTIPDQREGGSFSLGRRLVMDGKINYDSTDAALLADYIEELNNVAAGNPAQALHPELYTGGTLNDPTASFVSSIDAAALVYDELSFSMAWQIEAFDNTFLLGFTPRFGRVTTYEYTATATSDDVTQQGELDNGSSVNLDIGYAQQLYPDLRVAVAIKNLIPQEFDTESGRTIKASPQIRVGSEYQTAWGTYAIDLDLLENDPLSRLGDPSQLLAFGAEWPVGRLRLRAGLNTNLAGTGEGSGFGYSGGVRLRLAGLFFDFSAGSGAGKEFASFQFGVRY